MYNVELRHWSISHLDLIHSQSKGLKLNPFTTMYYISPACFVFLLIPFIFIEAPAMSADPNLKFEPLLFLGNCCVALALNLAVFLLIGKTSALSMNVAGVVKDWLLIFMSSFLFAAPISSLSLEGYLLAFMGVCYYNYSKFKAMNVDAKESVKPEESGAKTKLLVAEEGGDSSCSKA